jgi:ribosomal protein L16 Arg81 hydroxylase
MLDPISPASFFDTYWETKPLLIPRAAPTHFDALLSMSEVDRVLTTEPVAHPDVQIVDASRDISADQYTFPSGTINVVRLFQHFANGATIILNQLERHVSPLQTFLRALERTFSTRFQANVYLTPKNAQGFKTHYDSHDVFILQIHGSKRWVLYDTPIRLPMHGQSFERSRTPAGEPTLDFVLHPGDTIYIPRGTMHDSRDRAAESRPASRSAGWPRGSSPATGAETRTPAVATSRPGARGPASRSRRRAYPQTPGRTAPRRRSRAARCPRHAAHQTP